jgi:hypothetical protein
MHPTALKHHLQPPAIPGAIKTPPPLLLFQLKGDGFFLHQLITDQRVLVDELNEKSMQPYHFPLGELNSPKVPPDQEGKTVSA